MISNDPQLSGNHTLSLSSMKGIKKIESWIENLKFLTAFQTLEDLSSQSPNSINLCIPWLGLSCWRFHLKICLYWYDVIPKINCKMQRSKKGSKYTSIHINIHTYTFVYIYTLCIHTYTFVYTYTLCIHYVYIYIIYTLCIHYVSLKGCIGVGNEIAFRMRQREEDKFKFHSMCLFKFENKIKSNFSYVIIHSTKLILKLISSIRCFLIIHQ